MSSLEYLAKQTLYTFFLNPGHWTAKLGGYCDTTLMLSPYPSGPGQSSYTGVLDMHWTVRLGVNLVVHSFGVSFSNAVHVTVFTEKKKLHARAHVSL